MVAAVTAIVDSANVAVALSLTGAAGYGTAYVVRVDAGTGLRTTLFGEPVTVTGGAWTGTDYELGMDTGYTYSVEDTASTTVIATVAVAAIASSGRAFLKSTVVPGLNTQIYPLAVPTRATGSGSGKHQVLQRALPIIVTTARAGPTWTLETLTQTSAERAAMRTILASGSVLLLSTAPASGIGNAYVDIGDVTEEPADPVYSNPARKWSLPCTETTRPVGAALGGLVVTWNDVLTVYPTWRDVLAAKSTWADVLAGVGPDNPPG